MATKKKSAKKAPAKKSAKKKTASKEIAGKTTRKKAAKKTAKKAVKKAKKNKLGVKNSLVNNINARKKKGVSRTKKKTTIDKEQYDQMQDNWGEKK